jgi:antitoxin component YwqK of YwqJK toxin-antitoxin module
MAAKFRSLKPQIKYHRDGSLWAKGQTLDGVLTGYWEWFRKDGTKMRSGTFDNGQQVGEWTTYDKQGRVYKVTTIKPKVRRRSAARPKKA